MPAIAKERRVIYDKIDPQHVFITGEKARELLGWTVEGESKFTESIPYRLLDSEGRKVRCMFNMHNRPYDDKHRQNLTQQILMRQWADSRNGDDMTVNGETICISRYGEVLQGQHRLIALVWACEEWARNPEWKKFWPEEPSIEAIIVYGLSDNTKVTRTLDNVKPRSVADTLYTDSSLFASAPPPDREVLTRMAENGVRMVWARSGAKADPFNPIFNQAEAAEFLVRHPRMSAAVEHVYTEYKQNWKANIKRLGAGYASAFCYLMAASDSDSARYRAGGYFEKFLDMSLWDKAQEFWVLASGAGKEMEGLRDAFQILHHDGYEPDRAEKEATIIKAWELFKAGEKITAKKLELEYQLLLDDKEQVIGRDLLDNPLMGGIDVGIFKQPASQSVSTGDEPVNTNGSATANVRVDPHAPQRQEGPSPVAEPGQGTPQPPRLLKKTAPDAPAPEPKGKKKGQKKKTAQKNKKKDKIQTDYEKLREKQRADAAAADAKGAEWNKKGGAAKK